MKYVVMAEVVWNFEGDDELYWNNPNYKFLNARASFRNKTGKEFIVDLSEVDLSETDRGGECSVYLMKNSNCTPGFIEMFCSASKAGATHLLIRWSVVYYISRNQAMKLPYNGK